LQRNANSRQETPLSPVNLLTPATSGGTLHRIASLDTLVEPTPYFSGLEVMVEPAALDGLELTSPEQEYVHHWLQDLSRPASTQPSTPPAPAAQPSAWPQRGDPPYLSNTLWPSASRPPLHNTASNNVDYSSTQRAVQQPARPRSTPGSFVDCDASTMVSRWGDDDDDEDTGYSALFSHWRRDQEAQRQQQEGFSRYSAS
jgi:hypothetical protein